MNYNTVEMCIGEVLLVYLLSDKETNRDRTHYAFLNIKFICYQSL